MFERRDPFPWKIPVLILTGVIVLSSGIYIGVKSIGEKEKTPPVTQTVNKKEEEVVKDAFGLNKNCEIWLQKKNADGSQIDSSPVMLGSVPEELLNKSKEEILAYFKEKYPDRTVESMTQYEIVLSQNESVVEPSKKNKYSLEVENEFIGLYKYDINGKRELIEKTEIKIDSLPQIAQDEIQNGIIVNTEDDAYLKLEEFGS
ncbi:MAG: hypothetical protein ACRDA3_10790 [Peptostreptococcaceae bacterium]